MGTLPLLTVFKQFDLDSSGDLSWEGEREFLIQYINFINSCIAWYLSHQFNRSIHPFTFCIYIRSSVKLSSDAIWLQRHKRLGPCFQSQMKMDQDKYHLLNSLMECEEKCLPDEGNSLPSFSDLLTGKVNKQSTFNICIQIFFLSIYLSIYLSIFLSFFLSFFLSSVLSIYTTSLYIFFSILLTFI